MKMGICRVITSDQGGEFNNAINNELAKLLGIEHRLTTPYHPQVGVYNYSLKLTLNAVVFQANGLVERFNQTIQTMLVKFIDDKKDCWEDYLDTCIYAYNTSKHESSKFTPFELMFARKAILPIDLQFHQQDASGALLNAEIDAEYEIDMKTVQDKLEEARSNILYAQQQQKEAYDKKHFIPECFMIGALVLKKDFTRRKRKGGKLDAKWVGPYKILSALGRGLYRLENVADSTKLINRVNGVHLKQYKVTNDQIIR